MGVQGTDGSYYAEGAKQIAEEIEESPLGRVTPTVLRRWAEAILALGTKP